ncbi:hypothetical protein CLAIMM_13479 [Cladophialophora immunda]|nr:hypothetical protein CLAIMM_13479 [Cladophialophora immunda]
MASKFENRLFVDGEFTAARSGKTFDIFNPATTQKLGSVCEASVEDVDAAVEAATRAFESWSELPGAKRGDWLNRLADKLAENVEEMSHLEAITMGRPVHNDFV